MCLKARLLYIFNVGGLHISFFPFSVFLQSVLDCNCVYDLYDLVSKKVSKYSQ